MRARRRSMLNDAEAENFWPSFTDLISTVALILFVLVLLAYVQNLNSGKNLIHLRGQLENTAEKLEASRRKITGSERTLGSLRTQIKIAQSQLELFAQKTDEQRTLIAQSDHELGELRARLQGIALLRLSVLEKVKLAIERELGAAATQGAASVSIADNGNIVIGESLLFDPNSSEIKPQGERFLNTAASAFASVLADAELRDSIDVILVQGHTDERGSVGYNRALSAKRANAVLDYMFGSNPALEQLYGAYFASSAYSEFRPINAEQNEQAYEQNRRIEISVVPKDATVRREIDAYLHGVDASLHAPSPTQP